MLCEKCQTAMRTLKMKEKAKKETDQNGKTLWYTALIKACPNPKCTQRERGFTIYVKEKEE